LIVFGAPISFSSSKDSALTCGNNVCGNLEDAAVCPEDCKIPAQCNDIYTHHENTCVEQKGWKNIRVDVDGAKRKILQ
jgi:hypothetical protein